MSGLTVDFGGITGSFKGSEGSDETDPNLNQGPSLTCVLST